MTRNKSIRSKKLATLKPKKVVYLLGAGATHAEVTNLNPDLNPEIEGLLIGNVSSRVIDLARKDAKYLKNVAMVSGTTGSLNIELLISLIENSKIHGWAYKASYLKELVEKDIKKVLTSALTKRFYLHKSLLELHKQKTTAKQEELIGLISLNYDGVLDLAYESILGGPPNYCFSLEPPSSQTKDIPLLKLHGSFNWVNKQIHGHARTIEIIPLGSSKSYLHSPYSFIWNRALDILINCDVLRVVGCSLSSNDAHLIDLLFKAHLEKSETFDVEIIDKDQMGKQIRSQYGFFPNIRTLLELEDPLIPDSDPANPFKSWLKYKCLALISEAELDKTRHLKKVVN